MNDCPTRDRILDVAEKLFAENGFDGTSLRTITAAADANLAAVHYHFGSKSELLKATILRRIEPVNAERLRRLDAAIARADGGTPPVEEIVDAFVRPAIEAFSQIDARAIVNVLALVHSREVDQDFFRNTFGELMQRFSILGKATPHLSTDEVTWRMHFTVGAMIQAFNPKVTLVHPGLASWEPDAVADAIVAFTSAGFRASPSLRYRQDPPSGADRVTEEERNS